MKWKSKEMLRSGIELPYGAKELIGTALELHGFARNGTGIALKRVDTLRN